MNILNFRQNQFFKPGCQPLVILHGLFGSALNFSSILNTLKIPALAFDLRNHGQSFHSSAMSYQQMAQDVVNSLQSLQITKCDLLGHSMGGKVAMLMSAEHPSLIKRLIVEDIAPVSYPSHLDPLLDLLRRLTAIPLATLSDKQQALSCLSDGLNLKVAQFLLTNLKRGAGGDFYWQINLKVISDNLSLITDFPAIPEYKYLGPTFWIAGNRSDYLTPRHYQQLLSTYPNSNYLAIEAGHWIHAENKAAFLKVLTDIIR